MRARAVLTVVALALPMAGLILLLAQPELDVAWQHHPAHFWLVLIAAALSVALAYATGTAARRRNDARVFLVFLAFLTAAGFLGLHALATPGVLLPGQNAGFTLATPVGLLVAAVFAAASSIEFGRDQAAGVMRHAGLLRGLAAAVMAGWAAVSLLELPPLNGVAPPERASGPLVALAIAGGALYAIAVVRYVQLARRADSATLPVAMAAAFVLLTEAEVAVAVSRNWHASWWLWHVLILAALAVVAIAAHREWEEERFADLYLEETAHGTREISVLFADLAGFTTFSEEHEPHEVSAMLDRYFKVAIPPVVERYGGRVDRLVGDALMVTFNTRDDQPDHAERAARAALAIQEATGRIAMDHPDWPRFRVGVNSGPATVGLLGTTGGRTYTVIGDVVNLASRLEGTAPVGGVVIGAATAERLPSARIEVLGPVQIKGKADSVQVFHLIDL